MIECAVTRPASDCVELSASGAVPYAIVEFDGSSVVHVSVADCVVGLTDTDVITGGVVSGVYCAA